MPVDADGLDTERLAAALAGGLRPALCYLAPTYQNPSGAVMSAERRAPLGALADRYGFVVVDDDPYRELGFSPPPARLRTWVPPEWSVTLGTFSKVLAPGLRVGWAQGPGWLLEAVARLKQASDLHTSTVAQRAVADVVGRPGWLDARARRLTALYRHRAELLAGALVRHAGGRLSFAGPSLWVRQPAGTGDAFAPVALRHGVRVLPGSAASPDDAHRDHLRLSVALPPARLRLAVDRLAAAWAEYAGAGVPAPALPVAAGEPAPRPGTTAFAGEGG